MATLCHLGNATMDRTRSSMFSLGTGWSIFMGNVTQKTWQVQICVVSVTLSVAFGSPGIVLQGLSTQTQKASGTMYSSKRMADGKQWMTHNLDVDTMPSYCYEDAEPNCR